MNSASASTHPHSATPHIPNPRRLFIISPQSHSLSTVPSLLHSLTGVPVADLPNATSPTTPTTDSSTPFPPDLPKPTLAGYTTHPPLQIRTKYYSADVSIWVDEVPLPTATDATTMTTTTTTAPSSPSKIPTASQWKSEFLSSDARIVRDAIGAIIICIQNSELSPLHISQSQPGERLQDPGDPAARKDVRIIKDFLRVVGEVKEQAEGERDGEDIPILLVLVGKDGGDVGQGQPGKKDQMGRGDELPGLRLEEDGEGGDYDAGGERPFSVEWWEEQLFDDGLVGFEVVCWDPKTGSKEERTEKRNRFGEFQGMRRIREVLEAHEWADSSLANGIGDDLDDDDIEKKLLGLDEGEESGFNLEVNELEREMLGLKLAIDRGGGDGDDIDVENDDNEDNEDQVESLEALMLRMRTIKDMSSDLPEGERKRFAAKAVRDIMKEL